MCSPGLPLTTEAYLGSLMAPGLGGTTASSAALYASPLGVAMAAASAQLMGLFSLAQALYARCVCPCLRLAR